MSSLAAHEPNAEGSVPHKVVPIEWDFQLRWAFKEAATAVQAAPRLATHAVVIHVDSIRRLEVTVPV